MLTLLGLVLLAVADAGLGALLDTVPGGEVAMRAAGSAYLLWLAWRIARGGEPDVREGEDARPAGFVTGVVLLWLNPMCGWTDASGGPTGSAQPSQHTSPEPSRFSGPGPW